MCLASPLIVAIFGVVLTIYYQNSTGFHRLKKTNWNSDIETDLLVLLSNEGLSHGVISKLLILWLMFSGPGWMWKHY